MNEIKIESGVPFPRARGSKLYPLREMKIGDSFKVPDKANLSSIRCIVDRFSKNNREYKFTVRKSEGGHRVWRVANPTSYVS